LKLNTSSCPEVIVTLLLKNTDAANVTVVLAVLAKTRLYNVKAAPGLKLWAKAP